MRIFYYSLNYELDHGGNGCEIEYELFIYSQMYYFGHLRELSVYWLLS